MEDHVLRVVDDPLARLLRDDGTRGRSDGLPDRDDGEDGRRDPPVGGGGRTVVGRGGIRTDRLGCDDVALLGPTRPERLEAEVGDGGQAVIPVVWPPLAVST